jgi:hypothetical protein
LKASPGVALLWFYFAIMLLFAGLILALSMLKCQKDAIKREMLKNDDSAAAGSLPKQQGDAVLPIKEKEGNKYFRNEMIVGFAHNLERSSSSQYHDDQTTANDSSDAFDNNNNGDDDGEEFKNDDDYIV